MIKINGYKSYDGGKSGDGTYQTLINHVPGGIRVIVSGYLGNCGLIRHIRPAALNILNDIDPRVTQAWEGSDLGNPLLYAFHNKPFHELLTLLEKEYKGREEYVFIYLDPPYEISTRKSKKPMYRFEMTLDDHKYLLSRIHNSSFKVMISHYPCDLYDQALAGWNTHDFYSKIRNGMALERIYMNYELRGQLHDYSYLGMDFRQREANNRIRRNIIKKLDRLPVEVRNSILSDITSHYNAMLQTAN